MKRIYLLALAGAWSLSASVLACNMQSEKTAADASPGKGAKSVETGSLGGEIATVPEATGLKIDTLKITETENLRHDAKTEN